MTVDVVILVGLMSDLDSASVVSPVAQWDNGLE